METNTYDIAKQMFYELKHLLDKTDIRTAMTLQPVLNLVLEYILTHKITNFERLKQAMKLYSEHIEIKMIQKYIEAIDKIHND